MSPQVSASHWLHYGTVSVCGWAPQTNQCSR
uniref:Uncharacterized protein n=1 Tax=Anguilla anguilla TaxID=7936 RepID=A0A0E9PJZ9_ANGAN